MRKLLILLLLLFCSCNVQKSIIEKDRTNIVADNSTNVITSVKIIEYDTTRYIINDTIYQPVKKITYINQKEDNTSSYKEETNKEVEDKNKTTNSFYSYLICIGIGIGISLVVLIIIRLIKWYVKRKKGVWIFTLLQ